MPDEIALGIARDNMREVRELRLAAGRLPRHRWWKRRRLLARADTIELATGRFLADAQAEDAYMRALAQKIAPHLK